MKLSNYSFLFEHEGECFIFSSLSKSFLQIDKESFDILVNKQKGKRNLLENDIDKELYNELKKRFMICESHKDEFLIFKSVLMNVRNSNSSLSFTIAPTMDCCFSCFYCFEKGNHSKKYITEKVMDSIIKNIQSRKELEHVHISWFGGEPLMAIDKMQEFYHKLMKVWKGEFSSHIITTAHHITRETIDILKEIKVTSMQITLDGTEKTHNNIKQTKGCDNAFRKVISNIDMLVEQYPELSINIRVNTTKNNINEYIELHSFFTNKYQGKKLELYPGIVKDRSKKVKKDEGSIFFDNNDCAMFALDLWNKNKIYTNWLSYEYNFAYECGIRNKHMMIVDPEGYLYKCWELIGNKRHAVGKLDEDGNMIVTNHIELNRSLYGADPLYNKECVECSYLPMCAGGCPMLRIENEFEGLKNELCTSHKDHIKEWLTTYLEIKKMGYFGRPKEEASNSES